MSFRDANLPVFDRQITELGLAIGQFPGLRASINKTAGIARIADDGQDVAMKRHGPYHFAFYRVRPGRQAHGVLAIPFQSLHRRAGSAKRSEHLGDGFDNGAVGIKRDLVAVVINQPEGQP